MQSDLNKHTKGLIERKQTTFLIISTNLGYRYKIDYIGKKEFLLEGESFNGFEILKSHPLLLDYQSALREEIYISSKYENADFLIKEIADLVSSLTEGYKNITQYFNTTYGLSKLLREGNGLFFRGPEHLGAKVKKLLKECKIDFTVHSHPGKKEDVQILLLGRNYIIAKSFKVTKIE